MRRAVGNWRNWRQHAPNDQEYEFARSKGTSAPAQAARELRVDAARLLQLRGLSVLAMASLALFVFPMLAPGQPLLPLLGTTAALFVFNLLLLWTRYLRTADGAFVQLAIDLLGWGLFLYFSGGVTNPAISLLLPLVAVGAAILPPRSAWALAGVAVAIYTLLWNFHQPVRLVDEDMAMYWHLAGMWLTFAFSALVVVWFVSRFQVALALRERELALANAARTRDAYVVGLGKLAAGAAHRLGTPLGTLRILVDEMRRRDELDADAHTDLGLMGEQLDHCKEILGSLTREAHQPRAEQAGTMDAEQWLQQVFERWHNLRPYAAAELHCAASVPGTMLVADASLGEALHNLIDNAATANASAGDDVPPLSVEASCADGRLVVDVCDRGPGMPSAVAEVVRHGPFHDAPTGMGVGLLLAHVAIDRHGGELEFLPRGGGGSIARLRVPLQEGSA